MEGPRRAPHTSYFFRYSDTVRNFRVSPGTTVKQSQVLNRNIPEGREKSLMLTHLELAAMYANKAYASQYPIARR